MFADFSDALARLALSRLAPDRAHTRADLDALPPLLTHALRRRLHREATRRLDAAAPWVSPVPDLWRDDTLAEVRYPANEWAPIVRETSEWLVQALVHPAETFPDGLPESGEMETEEVLDRMGDLGAYPYLRELVERYAEKKDLAGYDRETLRGLIDRVDRRIASELDAEGWHALLGPLYDVAGVLPEFSDGIPGRLLAEVFAARGRPGLGAAVVAQGALGSEALMDVLAEALAAEPDEISGPRVDPAEVIEIESQAGPNEDEVEDAVEVEPVSDSEESGENDPEEEQHEEARLGDAEEERVGLVTLADVLAQTYAEPSDVESELPVLEAPDLSEPAGPDAPGIDEPETHEEADGFDDETEAEDEPLWARLARSRGSDALAPSEPEEQEPLWRRFASDPTGELVESSEGQSVESADGLEARVLGEYVDQREVYLDALFDNDEADYYRVLGLLDQAATWSAATEIIGREVFRRYHVHIYSEPAASFTDAVEQRFAHS